MKCVICPRCKKLYSLCSFEQDTTKFCKMCGSALYAIKNINGTDVNCEELI